MLDINEIPDNVLSDIMENRETELESDVEQFSPQEAFDYFLTWNGIMGYTGMILEAVDGLEAAGTIAEIRVVMAKGGDSGDVFNDIKKILAEKGHRKNQTLMLLSQAMDQGFAYRAIALIKVRELL